MNDKLVDDKAIQQLIAGDEAAFTAVYELYSEKVYRLAFRFLKDREQSEEIVQETFINLWLSKEKLDPGGNLWLYLYVISKRLSLNAVREVSKSSNLIENLINRINNLQNTTEDQVLAHDLESYAGNIIKKLPKQQQLVFKLSRVEGLSHKEIAEQLRISPNTVKNHMVEALKTIKSHLKYSDYLYLMLLFIHF